jgi:hypothetical protein
MLIVMVGKRGEKMQDLSLFYLIPRKRAGFNPWLHVLSPQPQPSGRSSKANSKAKEGE